MQAIVQTRHGQVRGTTAANGVRAFLGVSYAAPPVGANRLRPPQPVEPWTGIRDATVIGPEPPQPQFGMDDASGLLFDPAVMGDDCLNLNIWTPDLGAVGLPVMVFSPGGAFRYNSGGSYDGSRFARDGVVLVSINWRTGADGFLYLGEGDDGANLGLLDQVAALAWVRENIAAFGGDPGRLTVFGESTGAMSIGDLLSMPRAEGLFRRAALESGAAHHVIPADEAARIGARLAEVLGVPATRDEIAQVPVARFLQAQARIDAEVVSSPDPARWGAEVVASVMPFHPVVDGDVLPAPPIDRIGAGASAEVDVMVGTNADDWRYSPVLGGFIDQITEDILAGPVTVYGFWSIAAYGLDAESVLPRYRGGHPVRQRAGRSAGGGDDRLVGPRAGPAPGRRARARTRRHLHVRVRLAVTDHGRAPGILPRPRDAVRLRHPRPAAPPDDGRGARDGPTAGTRRHDAPRLGQLRIQGRTRLAALRPRPARRHALQPDVLTGRGPVCPATRSVDRGALTAACSRPASGCHEPPTTRVRDDAAGGTGSPSSSAGRRLGDRRIRPDRPDVRLTPRVP